ncbi:unnamed protein product [Chrysodeixis includens]|uniref:Uncharacterized protein n=1 Tax=Chrysodeixis includens TaxID=689277 RepID=A0A9P0BMI8_CHRIL|nr:unnamed protein product [Chrysodeixis includens]
MTEGDIELFKPLEYPAGRLIIKYLQEAKEGATMGNILQRLRSDTGNDSNEFTNTVASILENGTALGFFERKGSPYINWTARVTSSKPGSKRPRSCARRRRKRCIRHKRSRCPQRKR